MLFNLKYKFEIYISIIKSNRRAITKERIDIFKPKPHEGELPYVCV